MNTNNMCNTHIKVYKYLADFKILCTNGQKNRKDYASNVK